MIKAIIFDMDGVLVNTEPVHYQSHLKAFEKYGIHLTEQEYYEEWTKKGKGTAEFVEKYNLSLNQEDYHKLRRDLYAQLLREELEIIGNSPQKVKELSQHYPLALVSSSHSRNIHLILDLLKIKQHFTVILGGNDVQQRKPSPEGFLLAAKKMNIPPAECVVIEDSEKGVLAAHAAGMKCIAIPTEITKDHDFSKATMKLDHLNQVTLQLLNSL